MIISNAWNEDVLSDDICLDDYKGGDAEMHAYVVAVFQSSALSFLREL